jgi:CRISPR system Cascade subunit CasE
VTLYLSRLPLNLQSPEARRDALDPYQLHRTLLAVFDATRREAGVLHRLEIERVGQASRSPGEPWLLVQSWCPGDWVRLPEGYLGREDDAPEATPRVFEPAFAAGLTLRFRLRGNPTFKRGRRRLAWLGHDAQLAWLQRRMAASGCEVRQARVLPEGLERLARPGRPRHVITQYAALFDGLIEVNDPEQLAAVIRDGLGSGKAFGCGLLSVAPA